MTESTFKKTNWPVFRSLASFRPSDLPGDLIAGLTLAAIAILLSLPAGGAVRFVYQGF